MKDNIKNVCERFIANRDVLRKTFSLESGYIYPVAACTLTSAGAEAQAEKLKECKKILKKNVSGLSYLRGTVDLPIIVRMYLSDDPQGFLEKTMVCYDVLKKELGRNTYTALLALMTAEQADEGSAEKIALKGKEIKELLKKEHPILTGAEDNVMAGFMAMTEREPADICNEAEKCFEILKKTFSDKQAVQTCSHILSMAEGTPEEKAERVVRLYKLLEESGKKFGKHHELAGLAALSLYETDDKSLADAVCEIDDFLADQKGYGSLGFGKKERLMHAAMLTAVLFKPEDDLTGAAAAVSTIAMIAAQEAAMCAIIACTAASSAAAAAN
ncbi:DUF4003 family protein [Ruminococcus sp.]|uniref:DUF4003 family protein n=1 Tax=Ruminococcus sp. TaxID=41978 RepID=UPI0025D5FC51|nr:DUF4003 family protein [Ruminococcus sp.]MBQ8966746.1 DUF4003 family protein [Ruminococcus sp.]